MPLFFRQEIANAETPLAPEAVRRELAERWRGAATLEYQSRAVMNHAGEFTVHVRIHARLRRPTYARVAFQTTEMPEAARVRVSDGRMIFDRQAGSVGETGRTMREQLERGAPDFLTRNIPHPLDETAFFLDQFFAPAPFTPPTNWGSGARPVWTAARVSAKADDETQKRRLDAASASKNNDRLRLVVQSGSSRDTLTLDATNFAPLELIRVGDHAGRTQELLRETFDVVRLGVNLPASLFTWTDDDERGIVR